MNRINFFIEMLVKHKPKTAHFKDMKLLIMECQYRTKNDCGKCTSLTECRDFFGTDPVHLGGDDYDRLMDEYPEYFI